MFSGELKIRFVLLLVAALISGSIGVIFGTQFCSGGAEALHAAQCSAHTLSTPTMLRSVDQNAAAASKLFLLIAASIVIFASGLAERVKTLVSEERIRVRKFHTSLPRSWPNLFAKYPVALTSGSQP